MLNWYMVTYKDFFILTEIVCDLKLVLPQIPVIRELDKDVLQILVVQHLI